MKKCEYCNYPATCYIVWINKEKEKICDDCAPKLRIPLTKIKTLKGG